MFCQTFAAACAVALAASVATADPLPSWRDGAARTRIVDFVEDVTDPDSEAYVTPADRIAVFDNDGTLWAEQPLYFQLVYGLERIGRMAQSDPSILTSDILRAAAAGDYDTVLAGGKEALAEVILVSHAGLSVDAFQNDVRRWLQEARHPDTGLRYDQMTYQPMLELLRFLRDEGFDTYIVSGGGLHFMRAFAEQAYGIPPWQVIGSSLNTSYTLPDGVPTIVKDGELFFYDDKEGKPLAIDRHIGKRPILAAGNSDGDFQMLEYTTAGDGPRLGLIVQHTDAAREYAYDRGSPIGRLELGLDKGPGLGWLIVDMAADWRRVYSEQP